MKKIFAFLGILLLNIICIQGVNAEELAKCTYDVKFSDNPETITIVYNSDGTLTKTPKHLSSVFNDVFITNYNKDFDSTFASTIYSNGKLQSSCPSINVCFDTSSSQFSLRAGDNSYTCGDGSNSLRYSGTFKALKNDAPIEDKKEELYCQFSMKVRNTNYKVLFRFFKDTDGKEKFRVTNSSTGESTTALRGGIAGLGGNTYSVNYADESKYFSSTCSSNNAYFRTLNGQSYTIQTAKPVDSENGSVAIEDAPNDDGGEDAGDIPDDAGHVTTTTTRRKTTVPNTANYCPLGPDVTKDLAGALRILKIVAPLLCIIYSVYEAMKSILKGDAAADFKVVGKRFGKRIIYTILLFFIPVLVDQGMQLANVWNSEGTCVLSNPQSNGTETTKKLACKELTIDDCSKRDECTLYANSSGGPKCVPKCSTLGLDSCDTNRCKIENGTCKNK